MLRRALVVPPLAPWVGPPPDATRVLLSEHRWLSLVGPLGVGKTRLARELVASHGETVFRVDLEVGETEGTLEARLAALEGPGLVVLDAAERAASAVRGLLPRWLAGDASRRALVTSRVLLGVPAERVVRVHPPTPPEALALFEARLRAAHPDTLEAPPSIDETLRALGHSPLAIEALALRVAAVGPNASVRTPEERLQLTLPECSLLDYTRAAWQLLPVATQRCAASLATFVMPARRDDIQRVAGVDEAQLADLVRQGAVTRGSDDRFAMASLLRDYAEVHRADHEARRRHRTYVLAASAPWQEKVAAAERTQDAAAALDLWVGAAFAIVHEGSAREALAAMERVWPAEPDPRHALARGVLSRVAGSLRASAELLDDAHRRSTDPEMTSVVDCERATLARHSGDPERARREYARLLAGTCSTTTTARAHEQLGGLELESGAFELASQHLEAAHACFVRLEDRAGIARVEHTRGLLALERGDLDEARRTFAESLARHESIGAARFAAIARFDLGAVELERFQLGAARRALSLALHRLTRVGDHRQVALTHGLLGVCAHFQGDTSRAWAHLHAAREACDPEDALVDATLAIHEAHVAGETAPDQAPVSDEVRQALRLFQAGRERSQRLVYVAADGRSIEGSADGPVAVASDAGQRILAALVDAHERGDAGGVHRDALIRVGWPERRRIDPSARNRLNVELSRLRKAGLREHIHREGEFYGLRGPVVVEQ
jgi:tetratricopeptide (TPR) repeat protein